MTSLTSYYLGIYLEYMEQVCKKEQLIAELEGMERDMRYIPDGYKMTMVTKPLIARVNKEYNQAIEAAIIKVRDLL